MTFTGKVVLACGGRDYADRETVDAALTATCARMGIALLVNGGAPGADWLAKEWAQARGIQTATFDANWDFYSKKAGPLRNKAMAHFLTIDAGVAFHGGTGTENMCAILESKGVKVWRVPKGWRPR